MKDFDIEQVNVLIKKIELLKEIENKKEQKLKMIQEI